MQSIDPEHHDGTSDATPGGERDKRRPGELTFAAFLLVASLALFWNAFGIAGFSALSSPGAIPMATTFMMVVSAGIILYKATRLPLDQDETIARDIFPSTVILFVGFLVAYGLLLRPLGFLPTSALFLIVAIKTLSGRGWVWTVAVSLGSLIMIWLIFRIVFTVLMPAGIVPEGEVIQLFRTLISGGTE